MNASSEKINVDALFEFKDFLWLNLYRRFDNWILELIIMILGIYTGIRILYAPSLLSAGIWCVAFGWYVIAPFFVAYRASKQNINSRKLNINVSSSGIVIKGCAGENAISWAKFVKLKKYNLMFAFYLDRSSVLMIPMRYLNDSQKEFISDLIAKNKAIK